MLERANGKNVTLYNSLAEQVAVLKRPRRVLLMVPSGATIDVLIKQIKPLLEAGDIIIDGGNSHFRDTERRQIDLANSGIEILGTGISGGAEGALNGPSIMPGGTRTAYAAVSPIFNAIASQVGKAPCVAYMGPRGSGHYVKMIHNGIEYGDMQLIADAYDLLRRGLGLPMERLAEIFDLWNEANPSYLLKITAEIIARKDEVTGKPLVSVIVDQAEQKGTGRWMSQEALELGYPVPTINAALDARNFSIYKTERQTAARKYTLPAMHFRGNPEKFITAVGEALFASKICCYAQGMGLLVAGSRAYGYDLNLAQIAHIWRGGCIIRANLLEDVYRAYSINPDLPNLLLSPLFQDMLLDRQKAWRLVLKTALDLGIAVPALSASLTAFDSYRNEHLPANLIQAQRDYFGAHTYQRIDSPGKFHTDWLRNKSSHGEIK